MQSSQQCVFGPKGRLPAGYEHNVDKVMEGLLEALDDPELPLLQWTEVFANVGVSPGCADMAGDSHKAGVGKSS